MEGRKVGGPLSPLAPGSGDPVGRLLYEQTLRGSDLCDVSVIYEGVVQRVHKCVLLTSQYFHALYESGLLENQDEVRINVGSPAAIAAALRFLYLRRVDVNLGNVSELMEVADYLQISGMKEQCIRFLKHLTLSPENCVTFCLIGGQYGHQEIYQQGYDYLIAHLPQVLQNDEVLSLDVASVLDIIQDNTMIYVPADQLFSFMLRWVEHDLDLRLPHVPELFCSFKLDRFTEEAYRNLVCSHVLVNMFPQCRDLLDKFSSKLSCGLARLEGPVKEVFLMAGHEAEPHGILANDGRNMAVVETRRLLGFLPWEQRWIELAPIPIKSSSLTLLTGSDTTVIATESRVFRNNENMQQMFKYDVATKKWSEFGTLIPYYERSKLFRILSLLRCRGMIYVVSASQSESCGFALNCYRLEEAVVSELVWQKELISGGIDPDTDTIHAFVIQDRYICVTVRSGTQWMTVLVYDFETGEAVDCSEGSMALKVAFAHNCSLVCAEPGVGYAKVLSMESRRWTVERDLGIPELPEQSERYDYTFFYDSQKLFVFGGRNYSTKRFVKSSFVYDFKSKIWEEVKQSPCRVVNSQAGVIQMSSGCVRCDIDCPHCRFTGLKRSTEYDILAPLPRTPSRGDNQDESFLSDGEEEDDDTSRVVNLSIHDLSHN